MGVKSFAKRVLNRLGVRSSPHFSTKDVKIGKYVSFGKNVRFNCEKVRIGDGVVFKDDITINADVFEIGDFGTIYSYCFFPGPGELRIGHNFWLGTASIVDSKGGTTIGNNVGVGAHSQLWTHMIFGDVMYGCRFHSEKPLVIEDDAWLVGHCLVSPVRVAEGSLAMLGSLVAKDMEPNRVYAGVPAKDITEKTGPQFEITSVEDRIAYIEKQLDEFRREKEIERIDEVVRVVTADDEMQQVPEGITVLNVKDRTYRKAGTHIEYRLIRFLLPEAKFIPVN